MTDAVPRLPGHSNAKQELRTAGGVYLCDLKTGFVGIEAELQLGAYAACEGMLGMLPTLSGALIIRCDDTSAQPIWIDRTVLAERTKSFFAVKRLWDDYLAVKAVKNHDTYQLVFDGMETVYPRVTGILKAILARPHLVNWQIKQAVMGTLKTMIASKRTPQDVLEAYEIGLFDPNAAARAHMERRGDEGRALHKRFELYLKHEAFSTTADSPWMAAAWDNLLRFIEHHDVALVEGWSETTVVNRDHGYAGTLDCIVEARR